MSTATTAIKFSNTTPAAPSGQQNITWQSDGGVPQQSVTASDPVMVGDTGSGGLSGNVPAPPAGSAAAGKFLSASGAFEVPPGGSQLVEPLMFNGELLIFGGDILTLGVDYGGGGGGGGTTRTTPALVQASSANAVSVSTGSAVTTGNVLVVAASWEAAAATPTCTDTLGTEYSLIVNRISEEENNLAMFVGQATASGPCTVTITGASTSYVETSVCEFSGCTATVDAYNSAIGNASAPAPISLTTTTNGDLIVLAVYGNHDSTSFGAGAGFTLASFINGNDAQAMEYAVQATAGVISGTFVATDSDDYVMGILALKAS